MNFSKKKNAAWAVALGFACWASDAAAWAQYPSGWSSGVVQPNLQTQRQAAGWRNPRRASQSTYQTATPAGNKSLKSAKEKWSEGRGEALFIAVQNYKTLKPLNGCANDARLWKSWFDGAFEGDSTVLSDDASLSSTAPTRENIMNALRQKADKDCQRLIVTFAGHGVSYGDKSFLCPSDAKGTNLGDVDAADRSALVKAAQAQNMIAIEEALSVLKNAKAKEVVVIFDACRDGSDGDFVREFAAMMNQDEKFQRTNGGFFVLTSCSTGEKAKEIDVDDKTYGAFTYHFVEGLKGKADFAECCDGYVSLNEAYNYARGKLGKGQSPELFMASAQLENIPTLARVSLDELFVGGADLANVDQWSDLKFLLRAGYALSRSSLTKSASEVGERTLDVVLENAPNNALALELRGSVRRTLGDYQGALEDWSKIGMKTQVYAKSGVPATKNNPAGATPPQSPTDPANLTFALKKKDGTQTGESVKTFDLLTVTQFADGRAYVEEKNNVPLGDKAGWIDADNLTWRFNIAANVVSASKLQPQRNAAAPPSSGLGFGTRQSAPMIRPGGVTPW